MHDGQVVLQVRQLVQLRAGLPQQQRENGENARSPAHHRQLPCGRIALPVASELVSCGNAWRDRACGRTIPPQDTSEDSKLRIGIDLGGTKIEALALDAAGRESFRKRVPTPRGDYEGTLRAVAALVTEAGEG
ncbi:MAG: ROK family protein, partial [Burkholderiales bacterium]